MINDYIDEIDRRLVATARQRARIVEDIREHLTDAIEQLVAQGIDRRTAEQQAIGAFGPATDLAHQFNGHAFAIALRRAPLTMAACGTAVVAGFIFAAVSQPSSTTAKQAGIIQQVAFFAAVLGLQFAFVAGLRVSVRAGQRWRSAPRRDDQLLLCRAVAVFAAGLLVAAISWTVVLVEVLDGLPGRRAVPLAMGIVVMLGATIVAGVAVARQRSQVIRVEPWSPTEADVAGPLVFVVAERGIRWMGDHPHPTCALTAVVAGLAAMRHAETTVLGALPWGVAQAAAVIIGYLLLGPALQLRTTKPTYPIAG
ncbi:MAG: permease prefix domain 1-containing protein [Ilumatobacteraceae bacterium]